MMIVISPAKKLDETTPAPLREHSQPELLTHSAKLIDVLRDMDSLQLADLMKLSMKLADLNMQRFQQWHTPFTPDNAKQAVFMFRGETYQGLDADSLNADDLAFAQQHLRILSGLYGVLRPLDLIQPYRLEMGTRLANPRGRNLYEFWGDTITDALSRASNESPRVLVNLASAEYFKAIRPAALTGEIITPVFKESRAGGYKVIGLFAKRARGMMARFIIRNRIRNAEQIKDFSDGDYQYREDISSANEWVFTR